MENPTSPTNTALPSEIPADERLMAALGYIPMLFVLPSAFKPKSAFCQKHAKQGMMLSGLFFVTLLIMAVIPALGFLLFLGLLALIGMGAFKAHSGNEWKMPGLAKVAMPVSAATTPPAPSTAPAAQPATPPLPPTAPAPVTPTPPPPPPPAAPAAPTPPPPAK